MSKVVERVQSILRDHDASDAQDTAVVARLVLDAIREPTIDMLIAGRRAQLELLRRSPDALAGGVVGAWRAMIDETLK